MKKILLVASLTLLLISCDNSTEGKIKKEFKEYVSENFNDPSSIKEIISITQYDTVSLNKLKDILILSKRNYDVIKDIKTASDSVNNIKSTQIAEKLKKINTRSYAFNYYEALSSRNKFITEQTEYIANVYKLSCQAIVLNLDYTAIIDTLNTNFPAPLYGYLIKFRQKQNDELIVQNYYAYVDSLSNEIHISEAAMNVEDINNISSKHKLLYDMIKKYYLLYSELRENVDKSNAAYEEVELFLAKQEY